MLLVLFVYSTFFATAVVEFDAQMHTHIISLFSSLYHNVCVYVFFLVLRVHVIVIIIIIMCNILYYNNKETCSASTRGKARENAPAFARTRT